MNRKPGKTQTEFKTQNSICLVSKDSRSGSLIINQEALGIIKKLNGSIAVCAVVGQYRSGKSFLLSNIFKKYTTLDYNPFQVGHEENGFTKGCWINANIPMIKSNHLLLVDTEGLESENNDEQWDTKLFMFSLLISSMFVYNTKNNLSADDFKKLAVMTHFSEKIKLHSKTSQAENEKKLRQEGPDFLCVVRDFHLSRNEYSADESLDRFLTVENTNQKRSNDPKATSDENFVAKQNEIKRNMINTFRSFKSFRLPMPASDDTVKDKSAEEALQMLDSVEFTKLRPVFKKDFEEMTDWIKMNLNAKCIKNTQLNGPTLAKFIEIIVDSINTDKTIQLHDTLLTAIRAGLDHSFELIKAKYLTEMDRESRSFPVKSLVFNDIETKLTHRLNKDLNEQLSSNNELFVEYKNKLNSFTEEKKASYLEKNKKKIEELNEKESVEIWNRENNSKLSGMKTVAEFESLLSDFKSKFRREQFEPHLSLSDSFWQKFKSSIRAEEQMNRLREKEKKEFEENAKRNQASNSQPQSYPSYPQPQSYPSYPQPQTSSANCNCRESSSFSHTSNGDKAIGVYESNGSANGRTIYEGPNGGIYIRTPTGNKSYI